MKEKVSFIKVLLSVVVLCLPALAHAQFDPPPDFEPQVYDVPFDDGVVVLVAGAIAYGLYKVWEFKKTPKKAIKN
jgi:hypothetical protein